MSTAHKIVLTVGLLLTISVIAPSAVAAIDQPDDWDDEGDQVFDEGEVNFDDLVGDADGLEDIFISAEDDRVLFRVDTDDGGGLDEEGLLIYIDTDDGTSGVTSETFDDDYYDGLINPNDENMAADYRFSVSDSGLPVLSEFDETFGFLTVGFEGEIEENQNNADEIVVELDREAIGDVDDFDVKFVYVEDEDDDILSESENYLWAPLDSAPVGEDGAQDPRDFESFNVTAEFGEELDDEAEVSFEVIDDGEEIDVEINESAGGEDEIEEEFNVDIGPIDDDVVVEVEVVDGDKFGFERDEIDNTVDVNYDDGDEALDDATIEFSYVEGEVEGIDDDINDEIVFTLENEDEDLDDERTIDVDGDTDAVVEEAFTINTDSGLLFDDGTLEIEVDDDESFEGDYEFNPPSPETFRFEANELDGEFTLEFEYDTGETFDLASGENEVTVMVNLSSDEQEIDQLDHVIGLDDSFDVSEEDIEENEVFDDFENDTDPEEGDVLVDISNLGDSIVDGTDGEEEVTLYNITLQIDEGLGDDLEYGETESLSLETVGDETELINNTGNGANELTLFNSELNETDKGNVDGVEVEDLDHEIEAFDIEQTTAGGNMVGAETRFDVSVETNGGNVEFINLSEGDEPSTMDDEKKVFEAGDDFDAEDEIDTTIAYTPDNASIDEDEFTPSTDYVPTEYNVTVEVDADAGESEKFSTQDEIEDEIDDDDELDAIVSAEFDVRVGDPTPTEEVQVEDVQFLLDEQGEEVDGELPWGDEDLAQADLNNDGEISADNVFAIFNELLRADTVEIEVEPESEQTAGEPISGEGDDDITVNVTNSSDVEIQDVDVSVSAIKGTGEVEQGVTILSTDEDGNASFDDINITEADDYELEFEIDGSDLNVQGSGDEVTTNTFEVEPAPVEELNATIDGEDEPTLEEGDEETINVTVEDEFGNLNETGDEVNVTEIDDDIIDGLEENNDRDNTDGEVEFEDVGFDDAGSVNVTFALEESDEVVESEDGDPIKETIEVEVE